MQLIHPWIIGFASYANLRCHELKKIKCDPQATENYSHKGNSDNLNSKSPLKSHTNKLESPNSAFKDETAQELYACTLCDKKFVSETRLKIHEKIHNKPYICQFCSYKFARKDHLQIHERRHTGEKPYVCEICNKSYNHMLVSENTK